MHCYHTRHFMLEADLERVGGVRDLGRQPLEGQTLTSANARAATF